MGIVKAFRGETKIPRSGELNTLLVVYSAKSVPDASTGFDVNLKPVANLWVKQVQGHVIMKSKGDDLDEGTEVYQFIGRETDEPLEMGSYLFVDNQTYTLSFLRSMGDKSGFISLFATPFSTLAKTDANIQNSDGVTLGTASEAASADDLYITE